MSLLARAAGATRLTVATIAARPGLLLLFVALQSGSNLLRFWLGRVEAQAGADSLIAAVGWLFLIARTFLTQWLHVAAARVSDDARVPLREAFRVTGRQALWFHGLILVSMATFGLRLALSQTAGFFAPEGRPDAYQLGLLLVGFAITYLAFLPLIPGYFVSILGRGDATVRWSLRASAPLILPGLGAAMLLAIPPALVRRTMLTFVVDGEAGGIVATALLDAVLTVLLMMLATAVYLGVYRDAIAARDGTAVRPAEALP